MGPSFSRRGVASFDVFIVPLTAFTKSWVSSVAFSDFRIGFLLRGANFRSASTRFLFRLPYFNTMIWRCLGPGLDVETLLRAPGEILASFISICREGERCLSWSVREMPVFLDADRGEPPGPGAVRIDFTESLLLWSVVPFGSSSSSL